MKKTLKILAITVVSLLGLLIIIPWSVEDKMKNVVRSQIEKHMDVEVSLKSIRISLLRNFPHATYKVNRLCLTGKSEFAGDTLFRAERIDLILDLRSLLKNKGFDVIRSETRDASVRMIVLENGKKSWDVLTPSGKKVARKHRPKDVADVNVKLQKLAFVNTDFMFDDRKSGVFFVMDGADLSVTGDMHRKKTFLKLNVDVPSTLLSYAQIPYLYKTHVKADAEIHTDLTAQRFVFGRNTIQLNDIGTSVKGEINRTQGGFGISMLFDTEEIDFKDYLSLMPELYNHDFDKLQVGGSVVSEAWIEGIFGAGKVPAFKVSTKVEDGNFKYSFLPKGVDNIYLDLSITNPGSSLYNTVFDVHDCSFEIDGNPFTTSLHMENPHSGFELIWTTEGVVDLSAIESVIPLEDVQLSGIVNSSVALQTSIGSGDAVGRIRGEGIVGLQDINIAVNGYSDIFIPAADWVFTPEALAISGSFLGIGNTDFSVEGTFSDYTGIIVSGKPVIGNLSIKSDYMDADQLMSDYYQFKNDTRDDHLLEKQMALIREQSSRNVQVDFEAREVVFMDNSLNAVSAELEFKDSMLVTGDITMDAFGGSITGDGWYIGGNLYRRGSYEGEIDFYNISSDEVYNSSYAIRKLFPVLKYVKGDFSGHIDAKAELTPLFVLDADYIHAEGYVASESVDISGIREMNRIAEALNRPAFNDMTIKDLCVHFTASEGYLRTEPFEIEIDGVVIRLSGVTGPDGAIDYSGSVRLPESSGFFSQTGLDFEIGGTFDSPELRIDSRELVDKAVDALKGIISK